MHTVPIRTLTLGLAEAHPIPLEVIARAGTILQRASTRYTEAGYEVQTVRLSTRPIFDDLADWSPAALLTQYSEAVVNISSGDAHPIPCPAVHHIGRSNPGAMRT